MEFLMRKNNKQQSQTQTQTWRLQALDTLFFREARPMHAIGNAELKSVFPPSMRTVAGAIRRCIGDLKNIDWRSYDGGQVKPEWYDYIGNGDDLGPLAFSGVWLVYNNQRLYPTPLNLLQQQVENNAKQESGNKLISLEIPQQAVHCDLGQVYLPAIPRTEASTVIRHQSLNETWLTQTAFEKLLRADFEAIAVGENDSELFYLSDLLSTESRLGIACDYHSRQSKHGLLYQTQHIRLHKALSFEVDISGLHADIDLSASSTAGTTLRLGGEGRMAAVSVVEPAASLAAPKANSQSCGIILYLLTPLLASENQAEQPLPGFKRHASQPMWQGVINGVELHLYSAVVGKVQREGGWDLKHNRPRAVKSYLPAGSAFYCKLAAESSPTAATLSQAIEKLHNRKIDHDSNQSELGYGHIAVALWQSST